jgi:predicted nucleic acid-binding protein
MKVVVDTNIVFSALVNRGECSNIARIFSRAGEGKLFQFHTSKYMLVELAKHHAKLKKASKLNDEELEEVKHHLFKKVDFWNWELIPASCWEEANQLVSDIDLNDIVFVALSLYLNAHLWTGDKVLYTGLKGKGFDRILSTHDMVLIAESI